MHVVLKKDRDCTEKEFLSLKEACLILGCSYPVVTKILESGELPYRRVGRRIIIAKEALRRWASGEQFVTEQ